MEHLDGGCGKPHTNGSSKELCLASEHHSFSREVYKPHISVGGWMHSTSRFYGPPPPPPQGFYDTPTPTQGGLSAGKSRLKDVMCPRQGSDPASGHPSVGEHCPQHRYGRWRALPPPPVWALESIAPNTGMGVGEHCPHRRYGRWRALPPTPVWGCSPDAPGPWQGLLPSSVWS